jgi:MFS family permease
MCTDDATQRPGRMVAALCLAEVLSMTGFSAYPALLPSLRQAWELSGVQAGVVSGAFFFGYMLAVPFLANLTDRIDARRVFAACCVLAGSGIVGFAVLAQGTASGALFQAATGAGLAGTYMPGLKALTDRVGPAQQSRTVAFYTASFGVGSSVSLALSGGLGSILPWRLAFALLASGPVLAAGIAWVALVPQASSSRAAAPTTARHRTLLPSLDVLAHREVRRYVFGYAVHCWELFGLRSWIVAFVVFASSASGVPGTMRSAGAATGVAALVNLLGLPASVLGNEAAARVGRRRWIAVVMCASAAVGWMTALAAGGPAWLFLALLAGYVVCVMADSATLTAGMVAAAPPSQRGAAMAVHSFLGFGAGFLSPMCFGALLDAAGSGRLAWTLAFGTLSLGGLVWTAATRFGRTAS